ncbi:hypothetical protein ACGFSI_12035 [Streptomyces virginiae]|uniref:hypothetical protein n=1 Tax=Streptomyces virginiae TaxID=1961 RepID=UPI00371CD15E
MGNLADESGTDVEMYRRARNPDIIHVISRSDAPEELLAILDNAGLERKTIETSGPVYVWHETPELDVYGLPSNTASNLPMGLPEFRT